MMAVAVTGTSLWGGSARRAVAVLATGTAVAAGPALAARLRSGSGFMTSSRSPWVDDNDNDTVSDGWQGHAAIRHEDAEVASMTPPQGLFAVDKPAGMSSRVALNILTRKAIRPPYRPVKVFGLCAVCCWMKGEKGGGRGGGD